MSLGDGSRVWIRPVRVSDAARLLDGFDRLSASSRQLRFLYPKKQLTAQDVRYLTDVDHHDHEAMVAISRDDGRGVGVARFIRSIDDPASAELAVTVIDEWQSRGLGTELLARLMVRAEQVGIRRLTALVSAENTKVKRLLRASGADPIVVGSGHGTVEYRLALDEQSRGHTVTAAGCAGSRAWREHPVIRARGCVYVGQRGPVPPGDRYPRPPRSSRT